MRKSHMVLILDIALMVGMGFGAMRGIGFFRNWALVSVIVVALALVGLYLRFEEKGVTSKEVAVLGSLTALSVGGRVLFGPIPNVQPSTFIVIITGYVFGPMEGFMVGTTTALISNFFFGHGPWTIWQMLAWGLAGIMAGMLGKGKWLENRWALGFYSFAWGFMFDWIVTTWFVLGHLYPLTARTVMVTYASGLWFDAFHAVGNMAFAVLLGPALITVLRRFQRRFVTVRVPEVSGTAPSLSDV